MATTNAEIPHCECYFDIVMTADVGPVIALPAVIVLGSAFGLFLPTGDRFATV